MEQLFNDNIRYDKLDSLRNSSSYGLGYVINTRRYI